MTAGQKVTNMFIDCRQLMGSGQRQFRHNWQICGGSFLRGDLSRRSRVASSEIHTWIFNSTIIFTRRWLSYANMIRRAARFVAKTPLDLFIHSDHFTPEGAILARLYRRRRTRVIVTLHSGWPVDRDWASWDSSDSAMVPSKTCADQIRELSGMSDVFITGPPTTCTYRSLLHGAVPPGNKRRADGHRKIVLLVTNALELNCFPVTALDSHFETLSFIGRIPESLKDRVLMVIRTKPGVLGENPILYRELCGFPSESLTFLDGLDFSQSISVADCVVGINLPTTGYFEVLRKGVPLNPPADCRRDLISAGSASGGYPAYHRDSRDLAGNRSRAVR